MYIERLSDIYERIIFRFPFMLILLISLNIIVLFSIVVLYALNSSLTNTVLFKILLTFAIILVIFIRFTRITLFEFNITSPVLVTFWICRDVFVFRISFDDISDCIGIIILTSPLINTVPFESIFCVSS